MSAHGGSRPEHFFGWGLIKGALVAGETSLRLVAKEFGTPLYVYSEPRVLERAEQLRAAFPGFSILYSVKSNPQPRLCRLLAKRGFHAGVSSLSEFELALDTGYQPEDIGYVGPAKRLVDLQRTAAKGCGIYYVESLTEISRLEQVADSLQRRLQIALRINTEHRPTAAGEFMAGGPSEFGIDEEHLDEAIEAIDSRRLNLVGFHTFVASQVVERRALERHFNRVATLVSGLASDHNVDLQVVNFGGGFGIPYASSERELDISRLGKYVASSQAILALREKWPKASLCLDVGRFLVGDAGVFLTEVVDVKKSRGRIFVITDSGVTGFARPNMPWAQVHPCCVVDRVNENGSSSISCSVVGPSCMPGDLLAPSVDLADPKPGDVLAFMNAGAYGRTMSLLEWGGFDQPREVNFDGSEFCDPNLE